MTGERHIDPICFLMPGGSLILSSHDAGKVQFHWFSQPSKIPSCQRSIWLIVVCDCNTPGVDWTDTVLISNIITKQRGGRESLTDMMTETNSGNWKGKSLICKQTPQRSRRANWRASVTLWWNNYFTVGQKYSHPSGELPYWASLCVGRITSFHLRRSLEKGSLLQTSTLWLVLDTGSVPVWVV